MPFSRVTSKHFFLNPSARGAPVCLVFSCLFSRQNCSSDSWNLQLPSTTIWALVWRNSCRLLFSEGAEDLGAICTTVPRVHLHLCGKYMHCGHTCSFLCRPPLGEHLRVFSRGSLETTCQASTSYNSPSTHWKCSYNKSCSGFLLAALDRLLRGRWCCGERAARARVYGGTWADLFCRS